MRQIHPVGFQEKFVASGVYKTQYRESQDNHLDLERWTIHNLPDQSQLIRIDRENTSGDWKGAKLTLLVEALRTTDVKGGSIERLDIHLYYSSENILAKQVIGKFLFFDEYVQISRKIDNGETLHSEVTRTKQTPVFLPANILKGFAAAQVMEQRNASESIEYISIAGINPGICSDEKLLMPFIGSVHTLLDPLAPQADSINIANVLFTANKYDLIFDFVKDPVKTFWVDGHSVLLRLDDEAESTSSNLIQYARRPE